MGCPRCGKSWLKIEGDVLICSCGYMETRTEKQLSYDELLKENDGLKQMLGQIKEMISDMEVNYVSMKEIKKLIVNL